MEHCKGLKLTFNSNDSKAKNLDPWKIDSLCVIGETLGLESKKVVDENDGECVTITMHFESRAILSDWVDDNLPKEYYHVATQI